MANRASAQAGIRADEADTTWCALRAAAVVGVRHRVAGKASEDAWAWDGDETKVVLAVADGLGALEGSGPVAAIVARVAVAAMATGEDSEMGTVTDGCDDLGVELLRAAVEAANQAVADETGGASTLVLAVVDRDGTASLVRVGDSTAFRLSGGIWSELFDAVEATPGDADDGMRTPVTAALPAADPEVETVWCHLAAGDALVLVSDGVGDPLRDGPSTVAPGLAAALRSPPSAVGLAVLADFSRQGCQDDRTMVGVWLAEPLA